MKSFLRVFATAFLLLLIVMTDVSDMIRPVGADDEGRIRFCESESEIYKGICRHEGCDFVCRTVEGFEGGYCRGLPRQCFCSKQCEIN